MISLPTPKSAPPPPTPTHTHTFPPFSKVLRHSIETISYEYLFSVPEEVSHLALTPALSKLLQLVTEHTVTERQGEQNTHLISINQGNF